MYITDITDITDTNDADGELQRRVGERMTDFVARIRALRLNVADQERILSAAWARHYATDAVSSADAATDNDVEIVPSREDWMANLCSGAKDASTKPDAIEVGERQLEDSIPEEPEVIPSREDYIANLRGGSQ